MLARPQFGSKMETVKRSGVEAVIALDISNSMLAEDVTPSRLDKSKKLISRLVDTFNNDKVGLIVFAGDAFTQLPITSDYVSAKMFLETINPSLITTQGTDIGTAIRLAMKSFTPQEGVGRAIIVITDGENLSLIHISSVIGVMTQELQDGNNIASQGFGTFEVKKKLERISINPATQQRMLIPPKLVLTYKPSVTLKEKFK